MNRDNMRLTGLMYFLVILLAGFSQGYVRGTLVAPGDALTTSLNIAENEGLFRLGLVTDLMAFLLDVVISVMLYQMFKPFNKTLALISSSFRLLAHPAIASLNLLNHYLALQVSGGADFLSVFDQAQLQTLSLFFMDAHRVGYLIAGAFFGLHCLLLGILIRVSPIIPNLLGTMMILAAIGYEMESFGNLLFPGNETWLAMMVGFSAALGEVSLTLFFLIKSSKPLELTCI